MFEDQYPADYICEAVDQTRGWFYSLHAISGMLFDNVAFKNVICLGHILDANGQKMSKSRPETFVEPWQVFNKYGADAFRWYMYTSGPPGEPRRFSLDLVGEVIPSSADAEHRSLRHPQLDAGGPNARRPHPSPSVTNSTAGS
jgi:isoleucyl-tRNA synthetase